MVVAMVGPHDKLLLAGASHALRTPIRQIRAYLQQIKTDDPDIKELVSLAMERCDTARQLLVDILDYAKITFSPGIPTVVDVGPIIEKISGELEESVIIEVASNLPDVTGRSTLLYLLLHNLISNGVKHNANPNPVVRIGYDWDQSAYYVEDNGNGVPSDLGDLVFEPFVSVDPDRSASGLGLAICREILETSGGAIWISETNRSRFYFRVNNSFVGGG
jgi:signal transduction histidine kinase